MNLAEELKPYLDAAFSAIWLRSVEPEEAQREILTLCSEEGYEAVVWDCARGVQWPLQNDKPASQQPNPLEVFSLPKALDDAPRLIILHNYHRFFSNPVVIQSLLNGALVGKSLRIFFLVLAPVVQIPVELEKTFLVLEHRLPDAEQVRQIAVNVSEEETVGQEVLEAALGLTRREAEDAFSLSLVKHDALVPDEVWKLKAQSVKKKRFMEFMRPTRGFDSLGGLAALKEFSKRLLEPENTVPCKGLLLLGPPGTGKSAFARALCYETKMPLLSLDVASLFAKHVGETEENVKDALATADAMGRCGLFVDEVEKALAGLGAESDSGVATRLFGTILTWLSDREEKGSDVFFIATANDVSRLPPEFSRAERFDGVFFIDLPQVEERTLIWEMYLHHFGVSWEKGERVNDKDWTGAEIRSCCRLAKALRWPLSRAAKNVVPVATTAGERIKALREWARNRVLSAGYEGIYQGETRDMYAEETGPRKAKRKEI